MYSTCSFNPVENEAVVAAVLEATGGAMRLVDVSGNLPALKRRPGLNAWKVRCCRFRRSPCRSLYLVPHMSFVTSFSVSSFSVSSVTSFSGVKGPVVAATCVFWLLSWHMHACCVVLVLRSAMQEALRA